MRERPGGQSRPLTHCIAACLFLATAVTSALAETTPLRVFVDQDVNLYVDNVRIGLVKRAVAEPYVLEGLAAGEHNVRAEPTSEGFQVWQRTVTIVIGRPNSVEINIREIATHGYVVYRLDFSPPASIEGALLHGNLRQKVADGMNDKWRRKFLDHFKAAEYASYGVQLRGPGSTRYAYNVLTEMKLVKNISSGSRYEPNPNKRIALTDETKKQWKGFDEPHLGRDRLPVGRYAVYVKYSARDEVGFARDWVGGGDRIKVGDIEVKGEQTTILTIVDTGFMNFRMTTEER